MSSRDRVTGARSGPWVRGAAVGSIAALVACAGSTPAPTARAPEPTAPAAAPSASAGLPTTLLPGVGMSGAAPKPETDDDDLLADGPPPACAKDEDCWSRSCCPAAAPEECVHASRARRCAIIDVQCKAKPIHYTCVCAEGACRGRLAPP
jgi:hypothetical protein